MSTTTKYEAVLREHGFENWKALGKHLFEEIPQAEDGSLEADQICGYIQYSFGLPEDRAREMHVALVRIGIIREAGEKDRYQLHSSLK